MRPWGEQQNKDLTAKLQEQLLRPAQDNHTR